MLDWLKNLVAADMPKSTAMPAHLVEALAKDFRHLDRGASGLGHRALRYVVDGEPLGLLSEIAQVKDAASLLGAEDVARDTTGRERRRLYTELHAVPPDVLMRVGKLLDAAPQHFHRAYPLGLPPAERWIDALANDIASPASAKNDGATKRIPLWEFIEPALAADSLAPDTLLRAVFPASLSAYYPTIFVELAQLPGFAAAVSRHPEPARRAMRAKSAKAREHALDMLAHADERVLEALMSELVQLAVDGSKQVRFKALPRLERLRERPLAALRGLATEGKADERALAVRALWTLGTRLDHAETLAFVQARREADPAESVRGVIDSLAAGEQEDSPVELRYEIPAIDERAPLSPATRRLVRDYADAMNRLLREHWERAQGTRWAPRRPASVGDPARVADYVAGEARDVGERSGHYSNVCFDKSVLPALERLLTAADLKPLHVVRLAHALGGITPDNRWAAFNVVAKDLVRRYHALHGSPSLLELSMLCERVGLARERFLSEVLCHAYGGSRAYAANWKPEQVWPLLAHDLATIEEFLAGTSPVAREYWFSSAALYEALRSFPAPPPRLVPALFETALGSSKADRPLAQRVLENFPDKEEVLVAALADGKGEKRAHAANWLGRLGHAPAREPVKAALHKEKSDVAQAAMLGALEALGEPLEEFVGPDKLDELARKALAKGVPAELDWVPWSALPAVRWHSSSRPLDPETVKGLVAHACRLKAIEPSALLRRYAALFEPADRERLGQFILDGWLKQDTKPVSREVAEQNARNFARQIHQYAKQHPEYYKQWAGRSEDELFAAFLPDALKRVAGSAINSKGILAIAAACCGADAAPSVARYLKEYYGTRAAHGRALIQTLAWIEHPSATQLMLSVGNRFRTKGFQDEALAQAQAMAERKGWTLADLADRTLPSGGFDERGVLELDYGGRRLEARLTEDLGVALFNEEGKKIASLPEPRKDDDEAKAKEAKKAVSSARKEIKTVIAQQTERFYEALCTERTWRFEDWERYLNRHPVVRKLVQRLVWVELQDGKAVRAFRPLDDGSLTGVDDAALTLDPDARVGVAHDSELDKAQVEAWQKHLADYEVEPLFQQFGKGTYVLPAARRDATDIEDFQGHVLDSFALRGRAGKLGYARGAAGDGGWFTDYEKRFQTLGLAAVIEFSGSPLPEEQRKVALIALRFVRTDPNLRYDETRVPLGQVPAVLVSECYHDLRLIAAEGSGFDAQWQKTVQY